MTKKDLIKVLAGLPDDAVIHIKYNADRDDEASFVEAVERRYPNKDASYNVYISNGQWEKL